MRLNRSDVVRGSIPTVATLPLIAEDGAEVYYIADATAGVRWRFRYNSTSASSTYKWEFIGGPSLRAFVDGDATFALGATYVDATVPGPQLTLPLGGDYLYTFNLNVYLVTQTTASTGTAGLSLAAAQPISPDLATAYLASGIANTIYRSGLLSSQPALRVVKVMQNIPTAAGGTAHTRYRDLQVTPVRVVAA